MPFTLGSYPEPRPPSTPPAARGYNAGDHGEGRGASPGRRRAARRGVMPAPSEPSVRSLPRGPRPPAGRAARAALPARPSLPCGADPGARARALPVAWFLGGSMMAPGRPGRRESGP
jgi:hypothetical protein